jgi:hypothetical protein
MTVYPGVNFIFLAEVYTLKSRRGSYFGTRYPTDVMAIDVFSG